MGNRHRSAVTGRYVKKCTAKRHPKTTVMDTTKSGKKKWRPAEPFSASVYQLRARAPRQT
jgi:hypothetical protein